MSHLNFYLIKHENVFVLRCIIFTNFISASFAKPVLDSFFLFVFLMKKFKIQKEKLHQNFIAKNLGHIFKYLNPRLTTHLKNLTCKFNKAYEGRDYQPYLTTTRQWLGFEHGRLRCKSVI